MGELKPNSKRRAFTNFMTTRVWHCGKFQLPLGHKTYVMGILNITPDSFSGDGVLNSDEVLSRAEQTIQDGADILDIGGESTRPGAEKVSVEEELQRVIPVIQQLSTRFDVPLSVDTTKAVVAREAINVGASIINDISGATFNNQMLPTIAPTNCGLILMHLRGTPQTMDWSKPVESQKLKIESQDVISEILDFWRERVEAARSLNIADERIALDAGFGFGKSVEENLEILRRGRELSDFGFPTLSATSRKSTIGKVLGGAEMLPIEERIWGTAATVALSIANGADMVRVHDVKGMSHVARMSDAVTRKN